MRTDLMLHKIVGPHFFCLLLLIGLVLPVNSARAEDDKTKNKVQVNEASFTASLGEGEESKTKVPLQVKDAIVTINLAGEGKREGPPLTIKDAWLDKIYKRLPIWVKVENIDQWAKEKGNDVSKIVLCMGGISFKDFSPGLRGEGDWLGFQTESSSEFKHMWKTCVSRPSDQFGHQVTITLLRDNTMVEGSVTKSISPNRILYVIFLLSILAALILFWFLARNTDIIRDPGEQPEGTDKHGRSNRKRYSLARAQMAWWFFVVAFSYLFIWKLVDNLDVLTPSVLALMGISAATGLGSAMVDASKRSDQENLRRTLIQKQKKAQFEVERLQAEIEPLNTSPAPADLEPQKMAVIAKQIELKAKQEEIDELRPKIDELKNKAEPVPSGGFLQDLLGDDEGVSFHRFQMFAWTLVLTVIFVNTVYDGLSMPDFDATLLGLMGISGGTYIGFKLPAQQG
jgi:hypothetical protein